MSFHSGAQTLPAEPVCLHLSDALIGQIRSLLSAREGRRECERVVFDLQLRAMQLERLERASPQARSTAHRLDTLMWQQDPSDIVELGERYRRTPEAMGGNATEQILRRWVREGGEGSAFDLELLERHLEETFEIFRRALLPSARGRAPDHGRAKLSLLALGAHFAHEVRAAVRAGELIATQKQQL